jgi:hypothetical protein
VPALGELGEAVIEAGVGDIEQQEAGQEYQQELAEGQMEGARAGMENVRAGFERAAEAGQTSYDLTAETVGQTSEIVGGMPAALADIVQRGEQDLTGRMKEGREAIGSMIAGGAGKIEGTFGAGAQAVSRTFKQVSQVLDKQIQIGQTQIKQQGEAALSLVGAERDAAMSEIHLGQANLLSTATANAHAAQAQNSSQIDAMVSSGQISAAQGEQMKMQFNLQSDMQIGQTIGAVQAQYAELAAGTAAQFGQMLTSVSTAIEGATAALATTGVSGVGAMGAAGLGAVTGFEQAGLGVAAGFQEAGLGAGAGFEQAGLGLGGAYATAGMEAMARAEQAVGELNVALTGVMAQAGESNASNLTQLASLHAVAENSWNIYSKSMLEELGMPHVPHAPLMLDAFNLSTEVYGIETEAYHKGKYLEFMQEVLDNEEGRAANDGCNNITQGALALGQLWNPFG